MHVCSLVKNGDLIVILKVQIPTHFTNNISVCFFCHCVSSPYTCHMHINYNPIIENLIRATKYFHKPRKICLNVHDWLCKSLATSSWAGGCIEKSYKNIARWNLNKLKTQLYYCCLTYKRWENLLSRPTWYGKSTMGACITRCKSFTEELCRLFVLL